MPFLTGTQLFLDQFTGIGSGQALGAWAPSVWSDPFFTSNDAMKGNSGGNAITRSSGSWGNSYTDATYGPDCDVAIETVTELANNKFFYLYARGLSQGEGGVDGYSIQCRHTATSGQVEFTLQEVSGGSYTTLAGPTSRGNAGVPCTGYGLQVEGTAIRGWWRYSTSWEEITSATNSTHTGAGETAVESNDSAALHDNFRVHGIGGVDLAKLRAQRRALAPLIRGNHW